MRRTFTARLAIGLMLTVSILGSARGTTVLIRRSVTDHGHAEVPAGYWSAHLPAGAWTHPGLLARGKEIYAARCAVCHGDAGDGKGPATASLPLKPPDLRDTRMIDEMAGNYWFWRVSEGGVVEPFRSQGSIMPAWKDTLSVEDRWAVIVYQHTFSGHQAPHVTSEHPQMLGARGHAGGAETMPTGGIAPRAPTPRQAPRNDGHEH